MSRVPANPYRVYIQRKAAQPGGSLPPPECHSFANLSEAMFCRTSSLRKPGVRSVLVALVIDEANAASHDQALVNLEQSRRMRFMPRV